MVFDQEAIKSPVKSSVRRVRTRTVILCAITLAGATACAVIGKVWPALALAVACVSGVRIVNRCSRVLAAQARHEWVPAEMRGETLGFFLPRTKVDFTVGDERPRRGRVDTLVGNRSRDLIRIGGTVAVLPMAPDRWAIYSPRRHTVLLLRATR